MNTTQLWQAALGEIEIILSKPNFNTWFRETFVISYEHERIVVGVPNNFTKTWLEKKYHQTILKSLRNISPGTVKDVIYKIDGTLTDFAPTRKIEYRSPLARKQRPSKHYRRA